MARTHHKRMHEMRKRLRTLYSIDPEQKPRNEITKLSRIQTDVSMNLAKQVMYGNGKNIVFSPVSIHVVLALMAVGFGTSKSRDEILRYLNSESSEEFTSLLSELVTLLFADGRPLGGPFLSFANGMWIDLSLSLKDAFRKTVDSSYRAGIHSVDFRTKAEEVRKEVNEWVEKETNGLIKNLLQPGTVTASTQLIFANAVYFKGEWYQKFDVSKTKEKEFYLLNGNVVQVPFITSYEQQQISKFDGFKVLRLPYIQGEDKRDYSMYFYLPDEKDGLSDLVQMFASESGFMENHLPVCHVSVGDFRFPKFRVSFEFEASNVIAKLGMKSIFHEPLTEIAEGVGVSKVLHKSFIEVNEEGTEAAGATAMFGAQSARRHHVKITPIDFVADHPFLFVIREDTTEMLLFVGQVLNPLIE